VSEDGRSKVGVVEGSSRPATLRSTGTASSGARRAAEPGERGRRDWTAILPVEVIRDPNAAVLYARLSTLDATSADVDGLVTKALAAERRPLPVEHPADALWWLIVAANTGQRLGPTKVRSRPAPGPAGERFLDARPAMY
jgi:hypothetical protein